MLSLQFTHRCMDGGGLLRHNLLDAVRHEVQLPLVPPEVRQLLRALQNQHLRSKNQHFNDNRQSSAHCRSGAHVAGGHSRNQAVRGMRDSAGFSVGHVLKTANNRGEAGMTREAGRIDVPERRAGPTCRPR